MRKTDRKYRFRPGRQEWIRWIRVGLAAVAAAAIGLAAASITRSIRTKRLNEELSALHASSAPAETAAGIPTAEPAQPAQTESGSGLEIVLMGMPDGSAIQGRTAEEAAAEGKDAEEAAPVTFHKIGKLDTILQEMMEIKRLNRDTAGWLKIENVLDLPVVYRDNEFYLNHDFEGKPSAAGTLFLDEYHPLEAGTQDLLIHGHNMKDGSMFAQLTHYTGARFLRMHQLITFTTLWEKETYQIFAVLQVSSKPEDQNYFNYAGNANFPTLQDFHEYIRQVKARAVAKTDIQVNPDDALLTLSTCVGDDRVVVIAKRVN